MPKKKTNDGSFKPGKIKVEDFTGALVEINNKQSIDTATIHKLLEGAMLKAYKDWWCKRNDFSKDKSNANDMKAEISFDWDKGEYRLFECKDIVNEDDITDDFLQISPEGIQDFYDELKEDRAAAQEDVKDLEARYEELKAKEESGEEELTPVESSAKVLAELEEAKADCQKIESRCEVLKVDSPEEFKVGEEFRIPVDLSDLDKGYIKTAISYFHQALKQEAKNILTEQFSDKLKHILTGHITNVENPESRTPNTIGYDVEFSTPGKATGHLDHRSLMPTDLNFNVGDSIEVYLMGYKDTYDMPELTISRSHPGFVAALFNEEVPELNEGTVEIKAISRQAGVRTKMMVSSNNPAVDPVGAMLGEESVRYRAVLSRLAKETVDILPWVEDPDLRIIEALKPAKILGLFHTGKMSEDTRGGRNRHPREIVQVICNNGDKRVAVGRAGSNVRLASNICGVDLNVVENDDALARGIQYTSLEELIKAAEERKKEAEEVKAAENATVPAMPAEPVEATEPVKEESAAQTEQSETAEAAPAEEVKENKETEQIKEAPTPVEQPAEEAKPVSEEKPEEPEPMDQKKAKEEEPIEHVAITGRAKVSLTALEEQVDKERSRTSKPSFRKSWKKNAKKDEKEEKVEETKKPVEAMPIYTPEEIEQQKQEDEEENYDNDYDDLDQYDDDSYYDEK